MRHTPFESGETEKQGLCLGMESQNVVTGLKSGDRQGLLAGSRNMTPMCM